MVSEVAFDFLHQFLNIFQKMSNAREFRVSFTHFSLIYLGSSTKRQKSVTLVIRSEFKFPAKIEMAFFQMLAIRS